MRKLVVMRGPQGGGKSTLLRSLGLDGHVLSPDTLRRSLSGPVMAPGGEITTSQEHNRQVWSRTERLAEERMARGELLVIDATHRSRRDFRGYMRLAERYRYRVACMDFSSIPLELALARNRMRPDYEIVPEAAVRRTHRSCRDGEVPEGVHRILWAPDGSHAAALQAWVAEPVLDADAYRMVCHIGDLQGCDLPLARFFDRHPFSEDVLYLFVGDLCDRGPENGEVMARMIDLIARPNVRVMWGNHEDYLNDWSHGAPVRSREFTERTVPQLQAAGITPEQAGRLCAQLDDFVWYRWREHRVFVNHAGLATLPAHPERIAREQYARGTGHYNDPVGARFSERAPAGWVQVHGHRNPRILPVRSADRCYNLEGQVEHGGQLRILLLTERGFRPVEIDNPRYKDYTVRHHEDSLRDEEAAILPEWTPALSGPPLAAPDTLAALRDHDLIQEKTASSRPWLSAFNFTRDAFFQRAWDDLNVRARGLFINNETGEIAARSYDKFFNLGERPETRPEHLATALQFPVVAYRKDNGYLGILGYDAQAEDLLFCSKTTPDSDFAAWFRDIFEAAVSEGDRELLRRYLRDTQSCMAFEVLDPVNDPHIIAYAEREVILLDVIRRHSTFQHVGYERLKRIGRRFGLEVKGRVSGFSDWRGLSTWMQHARQYDYRVGGKYVEGFVIEDSAGFQFKLKADFYNFWKGMRALKDRLLRIRTSGKALGRDISDPRVQAFHDWAIGLADEVLQQDIITLREMYLSGAAPPPEARHVPETPPDPAVVGFGRALDNLQEEAVIKRSTADGLLRAALAHNGKAALLREHPIRDRLVLSASPGETQVAAAEAVGMDIDAPEE